MGVKVATFYLASIASSLFAANQVAPITLSDASAKSAIVSQQVVVNRSLKGNRLPIRQMTPETDVQDRSKVPTIPDKKVGTGCKPPVEIPGRCFA
jgi:hypothetical protein